MQRDAATTIVSTVWLEILRAQRPVRYAEIAKRLPELEHNRRATALNVAFRLGYLERAGDHRAYEYSVTPRCTVPPGVPVFEVLEATT
jgi:hypothetical protein